MSGSRSRRNSRSFVIRILCCNSSASEEDEPNNLDVSRSRLSEVPTDVYAYERTLESLNLDHNHIIELPRQLFTCDELRFLSVSDNELTFIPPAISYLRNLEKLNASRNAITLLPDNIRQCKNLVSLDLSVNPLERVPENLVNVNSLQELYLNDVYLEFLPANFGKLINLRILELRENSLSTLPKTMCHLVNLVKLDLGTNDFQEMPEVVTTLINLTELLIDGNSIKTLSPAIGRLRKLNHLDASRNKLENLPREIGYWTRMDELRLGQNELTSLPSTIGNLKNAMLIKLDYNKLTSLPETIGKLHLLQELSVMNNFLNHLPSSIGLLRRLKYLYLDGNELPELPPELGSCTSLRMLSLRDNKLSEIPGEIGHLHNLIMFNIIDNYIQYLPISFVHLVNLNSMWIAENQSIPLASLTKEVDFETDKSVLTCFMLPQQRTSSQPISASSSNEQPHRLRSVAFAPSPGHVEQPGRLTRSPTPYPKELRALSKQARSIYKSLSHKSTYSVPGPSRIREATVNIVPSSSITASGDQTSHSVDTLDTAIPLPSILPTPESVASVSSLSIAYESSPVIRQARNIRTDIQPGATPTPPSPQRVPPPYHIAAAYSTQAHYFTSENTLSDHTRTSTPSVTHRRDDSEHREKKIHDDIVVDRPITPVENNLQNIVPTVDEFSERSNINYSENFTHTDISSRPITPEITSNENSNTYNFKLTPGQIENRQTNSDLTAPSVECDISTDENSARSRFSQPINRSEMSEPQSVDQKNIPRSVLSLPCSQPDSSFQNSERDQPLNNLESTGYGYDNSEIFKPRSARESESRSNLNIVSSAREPESRSNLNIASEIAQISAARPNLQPVQIRYQRTLSPHTHLVHGYRTRQSQEYIPDNYNINENYSRLDNDNVTSGDSENNLTPEPRCFVQNIPNTSQNIVIPTPQRPTVDRSPRLSYLASPSSVRSNSSNSPNIRHPSGVIAVMPARESVDTRFMAASTKPKPVTPQSNRMKWVFGQHKNATVLNVTVLRNPDLGFSFTELPGRGIFIDEVSGHDNLNVGDKVLEIEGIDVTSKTSEQVMAILMGAGRSISMMISRS